MSISKSYLKSKPECKVTFAPDQSITGSARSVALAGDFNGWSTAEHPLKKKKDGGFSISLNLPVGRDYQFRYYIDDQYWQNDEQADRYASTEFPDAENSVVSV